MTLERIEHKVFASEAPLEEMGQFGSALATTKLNTKDVAEIQALPAYTKGWGSAIISENNYPAMEEMNGVLNVMSYHTGYLYQEGIPVYSSTQTYSTTSMVKSLDGKSIYRSLKADNKGNPLEDGTSWELFDFSKGTLRTNQITNCILEIPQRIKYTLENGTLTIKAGSVVIVPYGTEDLTNQYPVGSVFINDNFKVYDTQFEDGKFFVWAEVVKDLVDDDKTAGDNNLRLLELDLVDKKFIHYSCTSSGSVDPDVTDNVTNYIVYRQDLNIIKRWDMGVPVEGKVTLPICTMISNRTNGNVYDQIPQIFNGMGYIGSTVWVDKGVKGLIPNGRNEDGTLRNSEVITDKVSTRNIAVGDKTVSITISTDSIVGDYHSLINADAPPAQTYKLYYKEEENELWNTFNNSPARFLAMICANATITSSEGITSFNPKSPFRAVDYNEFNDLSNDVVTLQNGVGSAKTYIKTTYISGTSGYIIYSNGLCEQWGQTKRSGNSTTISLLKTYSNSNYNLQVDIESATGSRYAHVIESQATSKFVVYWGHTETTYYHWRTIGYLASGQY